ncbi:hypothetical protein [Poriferisphaera sp. WC338]|uniref:hypothetical protein n=1 Tax=Poriferisphaera sp. WC338 TaxID=3425129 RepID=UPI003D812AD5
MASGDEKWKIKGPIRRTLIEPFRGQNRVFENTKNFNALWMHDSGGMDEFKQEIGFLLKKASNDV